jgi:two-component system response regulator FixJ
VTLAPVVFVLSGDPAVVAGVRRTLEGAGFTVLAYDSARALLDASLPDGLGCLVLDLYLPDRTVLQLVGELADRNAPLPFVAVAEGADIATAVAAMKAGAVDVLERPVDEGRLVTGVKDALELSARWRAEAAREADIRSRLASLSPREREVLDYLLRGHANKVIAARLGVSIKTVETHRTRIMRKMRARSVIDLVRLLPHALAI